MHCSPLQLSPREREVVGARVRGLAYKQIAAELKISLDTVKAHMKAIFLKLDVQCSLELLHRMQHADCTLCPYMARPLPEQRPTKLLRASRPRR